MVALIEQPSALEPVSQPLTTEEKVRLRQLEFEVERNLAGFLKCGRALLSIREEQLWRGRYASFADYCRERFAIARSTADQLCRSTQLFETLTDSGMTVPENVPELTLRPISQLPSGELQSEAWRLSASVSPHGHPTHTTTAKVTRMIREVIDGDSKRATPAREMMFTRPISRLAAIDTFDVNVCLLHVKSPEQARRISRACGVVAGRCAQIQEKLSERFH